MFRVSSGYEQFDRFQKELIKLYFNALNVK